MGNIHDPKKVATVRSVPISCLKAADFRWIFIERFSSLLQKRGGLT
jgi:hypothetical protein